MDNSNGIIIETNPNVFGGKHLAHIVGNGSSMSLRRGGRESFDVHNARRSLNRRVWIIGQIKNPRTSVD